MTLCMTLQLNEVKVTYISTHITQERAKFINFCYRLILRLTPVNIYDALYNVHEDKMNYSALIKQYMGRTFFEVKYFSDLSLP
jgi:hypothetical protein